jgi:hypothetical protein
VREKQEGYTMMAPNTLSNPSLNATFLRPGCVHLAMAASYQSQFLFDHGRKRKERNI